MCYVVEHATFIAALHLIPLLHATFTTTQTTIKLAKSARHVTRDLNPNDDLKNLRIKTSKKELLVSHDKDFIVIVIQEWMPAKLEASHLT